MARNKKKAIRGKPTSQGGLDTPTPSFRKLKSGRSIKLTHCEVGGINDRELEEAWLAYLELVIRVSENEKPKR